MAAATRDNMGAMYVVLVIAGLGIGGILVPASIITTIVCPDDLIATVSALTLAIRVVGGSIGYTIYYNVFLNKFIPILKYNVGGTMLKLGFKDPVVIGEVITLTGASLLDEIKLLPSVAAAPPIVYESIG
jgi:hypothetical protein